MALVEVCDRYLLETWSRYGQTERRILVAQQVGLYSSACVCRPTERAPVGEGSRMRA